MLINGSRPSNLWASISGYYKHLFIDNYYKFIQVKQLLFYRCAM